MYTQEFHKIRSMRKGESDHVLLPMDPLMAVLTRMVDLTNQIEASYIELRVMMDQQGYQFQGYTEEDHARCTCMNASHDQYDDACPVHGVESDE